VGALLGPIVNRFLSIRTMIIGGQFAIATFNICVIIFQIIDLPIMILVSMVAVLTVYQVTMGSYYFVYAS
jgi:hypothetical protein